jgi:hypothetical protein
MGRDKGSHLARTPDSAKEADEERLANSDRGDGDEWHGVADIDEARDVAAVVLPEQHAGGLQHDWSAEWWTGGSDITVRAREGTEGLPRRGRRIVKLGEYRALAQTGRLKRCPNASLGACFVQPRKPARRRGICKVHLT